MEPRSVQFKNRCTTSCSQAESSGDDMQVLSIKVDDRYQAISCEDMPGLMTMLGTGSFTGGPIRERWAAFDFYILDTLRIRGDFLGFTSGTFAFSERVLQGFGSLFEEIGEILPITIDGAPHHVLNVLRVVDALDMRQSEYRTFYQDRIASVDRYVFNPECLREESIFRIPQLRSSLFMVSGQADGRKDFYQRARQGKFEGLLFESLWTA